ncbi:MAG: hypothetical protein A3B91_00690 [Candidatus Yanofskybacteria bacterium RIFCSPHIGHO2_02_FULL_41_29]|uniref:UDP-N-acetylglucosamine kinase n=1 Tax=Candidatus Yanofskybacteria bacterium RIFCSPHIGHO2_01_FULL_41_53 TaxID=1802663 RepID=A0A1F8EJW7_9BACT|nr:MAG: hypothetical protein A2650_00260 [Candidatus Yanofskybacteria bacterium RIFCSPHIGHO2_01_FULL_41_53]OGN12262.1 MAG: hypothetical protein A3B91_00690 [Candidatus Yanofskybacteria bacterium RIFCSPHIGHO2_02_FULL_41_29]OGN18573.1 MAG: hypothetical protein A3F48_03830 [Candidatus Yanofskybacteria bacterium RIFCSPHIGHO2_12_FULL_41_9]OGN23639.1 MAG: hypothetical protein A2916_01625 [Candidatus Yanofskybacteria bacterium RIFCSPLOWO2_01_FULL_41_67]OGN29374.1 MAG: hypothetical protein A3H54_03900 
MKLILFGGVQGVGKSTLLHWLENQPKHRITLLNPGELFRRYFYNEQVKTIEEIEELIVSEIEKMPSNSVLVAHWHYAVRQPSKYIPQISFSRLKRIAESGKVEQIVLCLVEASVDSIYERRLIDHQTKKREFSKSSIEEEIHIEEEFLAKYQILFSKILGSNRVTTTRINNNDLGVAESTLHDLFGKLLS